MNKSRTPRLKTPKFAVFNNNEVEEKIQDHDNLSVSVSQNLKNEEFQSVGYSEPTEKQKKINFKITSLQIDSDIEYKVDYLCFLQKKKKYEVINQLLSDALSRLDVKFPNSL